jgi:hypothetical protein
MGIMLSGAGGLKPKALWGQCKSIVRLNSLVGIFPHVLQLAIVISPIHLRATMSS